MGRPSMYPEEFRREACQLARQVIAPSARWAAGLGIPDQTLCNWLKTEDKAKPRGQDPEALSESEPAELKRLRKENAELKMDWRSCSRRRFVSPRRRTLSRFRFVSAHRTPLPSHGLGTGLLLATTGGPGRGTTTPGPAGLRYLAVLTTPIWQTPSGRSAGARGAPMEHLGSTVNSVELAPGSGANASPASWQGWTSSAYIHARSGAEAASTWLRLRTCSSATSAPAGPMSAG